MSPHITVESHNSILKVGLNRPDKKNALTREMYAELAAVLDRLRDDPSLRVLLIHGTSDCFTSGNDLKDFLNAPETDDSSPVVKFLHGIAAAPKPIVAAVAGPAIGIGTTLLLHCDLIYAAENSRFQLPFVNLGLCPEAAASDLLPRLVGYHRAAELLLLGEPFSGPQAHAWGLVNHVVPDADVLSSALSAARKLASLPPGALAVTKSLLKQGQTEHTRRIMDLELRHFHERLRSPECAEALAAFFERRPPDFSRF